MEIFSKRLGLRGKAVPVSIRNDAPEEMRRLIIMIAQRVGLSDNEIRATICDTLPPDPETYEWLQQPLDWEDEYWPINDCEWHFVYDIIEGLIRRIAANSKLGGEYALHFSSKTNEYLLQEGIGWEIRDGRVIARGSDAFQASIDDAVSDAADASMPDAAGALSSALNALSSRPDPDLTGAISHASAALEAVSNEVAGTNEKSLGKIIELLELPRPLDQAIDKMYGFASQHGRHFKEGRQPTFEDAQLVVHVASAAVTYLLARARD